MVTAPTPASHSGTEILLRAAALFSQWEEARPDGSIPLTPELRKAFDQFVAEVLSDSQETNLGIDDVKETLRGAAGLSIGHAEASGPRRAMVALTAAYRDMQAIEPLTSSDGRIMLSIQARPDAELEMDELAEITETLLGNAGPKWELIFGYGVVPDLFAEVRLMFLSAPRILV